MVQARWISRPTGDGDETHFVVCDGHSVFKKGQIVKTVSVGSIIPSSDATLFRRKRKGRVASIVCGPALAVCAARGN